MNRKPSKPCRIYIPGDQHGTPIANRILEALAFARERNIAPDKAYITQATFVELALELAPRLHGRTSAQGNYINGIRIIVR